MSVFSKLGTFSVFTYNTFPCDTLFSDRGIVPAHVELTSFFYTSSICARFSMSMRNI